MLQPAEQHFAQAHDLWRAICIQNVHVQRKARFQIRQTEQSIFEVFRVNIPAFWHQHDAHMLVTFVPNVIENRQLFIGDQLRNLLDQFAFLDLIGNFGDDKLPRTAGQLFNARWFPSAVLPAVRETGAHPHRAASAGISSAYNGAAINQHPASCKVGPTHNIHQLFLAGLWLLD